MAAAAAAAAAAAGEKKAPLTREEHAPWRSMCKGVTFRVLATLTTVVLSYMVTGAMTTALKIGPLDFALKLVVFYAHERLWLRPSMQALPQRSLAKMWSWKAIALSMTVATTIAVTGRADLALKLGPADFFFKLFLYYAHERAWEAVPYGRRIVKEEFADSGSSEGKKAQ